MAVGYSTILKIRRLEEECEKLGLKMNHSKHSYQREYGDVLAVFPKDDELPIYSRDAELFVGTLDDLERWIQGAQWMKHYLQMLRLVDDKKIARKEQDERNRKLVQVLMTAGEPTEVKN